MRNVSTGVSLCLDISKQVQLNLLAFQCVQSTVMLGSKHAKVTLRVLRIGESLYITISVLISQHPALKIQLAIHTERCMEMVEAYATWFLEVNMFTPLTETTAQ